MTKLGLPPYVVTRGVPGEVGILIAIYSWYVAFNTAYKISIIEDNKVLVRCIGRKIILYPGDINKIKEGFFTYTYRSSKGTFYLFSAIEGFITIKNKLNSDNHDAEYSDKYKNWYGQ